MTKFLKSLIFLYMRSFLTLLLVTSFAIAGVDTRPSALPPVGHVESKVTDFQITYEAGKPVIIAVIDSGFGWQGKGIQAKLCKYGHRDFSIDQKFAFFENMVDRVPEDLNSHGTNIVGLISRELDGSNVPYCFVVIKYYAEKQTGTQNLKALVASLRWARFLKANVINMSGGGPEFAEEEYNEIKKFTESNGKFFAAAGNEHSNRDYPENYYYPASYHLPGMLVVGNKDDKGNRVPSSNWGNDVQDWENGFQQQVYGITQTGTSQATAVATGKFVAKAKVGYGIKDSKREEIRRAPQPDGKQKHIVRSYSCRIQKRG